MSISSRDILLLQSLKGFGNAAIRTVIAETTQYHQYSDNDLYEVLAKLCESKKIRAKLPTRDEVSFAADNADRIIKYSESLGINIISCIDENFPYKLNDNIPSQQIYFGSDSTHTLEKDSNNNIYFKFTGQLIFRVVYSSQFTCSQIIAMLGSEYTGTSPSGITDCIKIPDSYNLVLDYDDTTQRIKVLSRTNSTHTNTHLKIIENVNGTIVGGVLKDLQNETNTKILLNNKLDNNRPSQQCYLMKDDKYIFEVSGTNVYFHYSTMMVFRVNYSNQFSCADMSTMVGETYSGTSPSGVENCIILPEAYDLVLDYTDSTQRIKVLPRTDVANSNNYFKILESLDGEIVGGHLMYLFNNQKLKRNQVFDIYNIPNYWKSSLNTAINKVITNVATINSKLESFFFITDQHWSSNAQKSSDLMKYLGNKKDASEKSKAPLPYGK